MNNGKGKGRANGDEDTENPSNSSQPPSSMAGRLTASAAGLAQSALMAPSRSELSNHASAALASVGKSPQAGGSQSSAWAESSRVSQQPPLPALHGQPASPFKAGHIEQHARDIEAQFTSFLGGIDSFTPSLESYGDTGITLRQEILRPPDGVETRAVSADNQPGRYAYTSVEDQQRHDGDEVLAILSEPAEASVELNFSYVEDEAFNWSLTEQQLLRIREIIDDLFPPGGPHIALPPDHPLNLVPPMLSTSATTISTAANATDDGSTLLFGSVISRETAMQAWMGQWESVLTRYADEVWGNLLPLVTEARKEIQASKDEQTGFSDEHSKA